MATANTQTKGSVAKLLAAVQQLKPPELRQFAQGFAGLRCQDGNEDPVGEETLLALVHKYSSLPAREQKRFNRLRRDQQAEKLTKGEEKELQELWRRVEQMNVTRLAALAELAYLRRTDIRTLLRDLGIAENLDVL